MHLPWQHLTPANINTGMKNGIQLNIPDYVAIANDTDYLLFQQQMAAADTTGFNKTQFYAFWMNAYNYLAVKTVCPSNPIFVS